MRKYFCAVAVQMFGEMQSCAGMAHELRQLVLSNLDRHRPQVFAIKLQYVECEQHRLRFDPAAVTQQVEDRKAAPIANGDLAINEAGLAP